MVKDGRFFIVKDIPLGNGKSIKKDRNLDKIHGWYHLDGVLVEAGFQEDFERLVEYEIQHGWKYLRPNNPIVGESIIRGNN